MTRRTKNLEDIKNDMSSLYDDLKNNKVTPEKASEMANIAGKFLRAEQLILAREVFDQFLMERSKRLGAQPSKPRSPLRLAHKKDSE